MKIKFDAILGMLRESDLESFNGWGYQDFTAGEINSTSVTITLNQNGENVVYSPNLSVNNSAVIVRKADLESFAYTGPIKLFSTKVVVNSFIDNAITLNGVPHSSWGDLRIYYIYHYSEFPKNYEIAPKFISSTLFSEINSLFVTEEELVQYDTDVVHGNGVLDIRKLTQAQYDALGEYSPTTLYVIIN